PVRRLSNRPAACAPAEHRRSESSRGRSGCGGAALRVWGFGQYGFWNDEAWVAISTRVEGARQTLLALCVTPLVWGLLLRPLALAGPPEGFLRAPAPGVGLL